MEAKIELPLSFFGLFYICLISIVCLILMIYSLELVDSKFANKANVTKEDDKKYNKNVRMHSVFV